MNKLLTILLITSLTCTENVVLAADPCAEEVELDAYAEPVVRNAANEMNRVVGGRINEGGTLTGPAPLVVNFYSNTDATFVDWLIYEASTATGNYNIFHEKDVTYTFQTFGSHMVKVISSNGTCSDSAFFTVQVTESKLECPNYFSPRSTPGENDEFRVAYSSLVSFKGTIINRWGNVLFEWSDPAKGWNGTFKGKAVSPGVYFYLIEARGSDGIVYRKKGDINLLE
jgi:gliding motility-associated-like protein